MYVYLGIAVVGLVALASVLLNARVLLAGDARRGRLAAASAAVSILVGLALIGGGFVLHPNAPHDQNWVVLIAGLVVGGSGVVVLSRTRGERGRFPSSR